jgi:signal transduction histidine kinase
MRVGIGSPIRVQGRLWGLVLAAETAEDSLGTASSRQLEAFTDLIAIAITNADAHAELEASRARVVASADQARRRIERDLHDGAQQRLVALALRLRTAQQQLSPEQAELAAQLEQIGSGLNATLEELRELARGIHPSILSRGEIEPALRTLVRRSPVPVELSVDVSRRLSESAITTVYYTVAEALTNTAKHAQAHVSHIEAREVDGGLQLIIRDDGVGGADPAMGSGLIGLRDRVEAAAGRLTLSSPRGHGTELRVELPFDPALPAFGNGSTGSRPS